VKSVWEFSRWWQNGGNLFLNNRHFPHSPVILKVCRLLYSVLLRDQTITDTALWHVKSFVPRVGSLPKGRGIVGTPTVAVQRTYFCTDHGGRGKVGPSRHTMQYYYLFGSRSIYKDGWKAELPYPNSFITGNAQSDKPFDENAWELYNLNDDYTERIDLA